MSMKKNGTRLHAAAFVLATVLVAGCESKTDKAVRFAESGQTYLEEGDLDRAYIQFNNALFQDGDNVVALRGAAEIAGDRGNFRRQARMLNRLLSIQPNDADANSDFARLSLLSGDNEAAKQYAQVALEQDPESVIALTTYGAALVLENRLDEATSILETALELDPDNPEIFNLLAASSIRAENFEDAIATINQGIEESDNPETLLVVKLVLAERFNGREEVIDTFQQLIEIAPENGMYRQRLGEYYALKDGDYDRAQAYYREALPLVEDAAPVAASIVGIERELRGDAAAETVLRELIEEYPDDMSMRFALPSFFCQIEDLERCRRSYEELSEDDTLDQDQYIRAINGIGDVAMAQSDFEAARESVNTVLEIDNTNAGALITNGQLLLVDEETETAIEVLRTALENDPDNAEGLVYLALAYEQNGQVRFADQSFARALEDLGYQKAIVDQYRGFLVRQGEQDRSMEVLDRYLRANPNDADAVYQEAESAMYERRFADAEASAIRLQRVEGFEERATSLLARALTAQERLDEALPLVETLLSNNPDNERYIALRSGILRALDRGDEVQAGLAQRVADGVATANEYVALGDILRSQGNPAGARDVALQGISAHPTVELVYVLQYLAEGELGNSDNARAALETGIATAETSVQLRTFLSNEYIVAQDLDAAIAVLKGLQADDALSPLTANNLASLMLDRDEDVADALEIAQLLENTENAYFADTLAWAYYRNNYLDRADRYSRQAVEGLPDNADVLYHRGVILIAMGDTDGATEILTRARDAHRPGVTTLLTTINEALNGL